MEEDGESILIVRVIERGLVATPIAGNQLTGCAHRQILQLPKDFPSVGFCSSSNTSEFRLEKHSAAILKSISNFKETSSKIWYDTVSDVVESKVHQCQQNSDA